MPPPDIRYVDVDFRLEHPPDYVKGVLFESADEMAANTPCPRYAELNEIIPRDK